jgi:hypothetical protein
VIAAGGVGRSVSSAPIITKNHRYVNGNHSHLHLRSKFVSTIPILPFNIHVGYGWHQKSKVHLWLQGIYTAPQHRNKAQGTHMTTAIFSHAPASSLRQYLSDVRNAARAFSEALFAAQDRQFVAQEVRAAGASSARAKAQGRRQLFALARQYDGMSPSLSAELRSIAARD